MEKTLLMRRQEFIERIIDQTNNSGLPLVILLPIFENISHELNRLVNNQLEHEKSAYETTLREAEANGGQDDTGA